MLYKTDNQLCFADATKVYAVNLKDIKENTSKAITNLDIEHIEGSLVNINENQIRKAKSVFMLDDKSCCDRLFDGVFFSS